jgi:hypothetical protein
MNKYRKIPVVVEAMLLTKESFGEVKLWITGQGGVADGSKEGLFITTLEGIMLARWGNWVIKGVKNEFYPCANDIFEMTYEYVHEGKKE